MPVAQLAGRLAAQYKKNVKKTFFFLTVAGERYNLRPVARVMATAPNSGKTIL